MPHMTEHEDDCTNCGEPERDCADRDGPSCCNHCHHEESR